MTSPFGPPAPPPLPPRPRRRKRGATDEEMTSYKHRAAAQRLYSSGSQNSYPFANMPAESGRLYKRGSEKMDSELGALAVASAMKGKLCSVDENCRRHSRMTRQAAQPGSSETKKRERPQQQTSQTSRSWHAARDPRSRRAARWQPKLGLDEAGAGTSTTAARRRCALPVRRARGLRRLRPRRPCPRPRQLVAERERAEAFLYGRRRMAKMSTTQRSTRTRDGQALVERWRASAARDPPGPVGIIERDHVTPSAASSASSPAGRQRIRGARAQAAQGRGRELRRLATPRRARRGSAQGQARTRRQGARWKPRHPHEFALAELPLSGGGVSPGEPSCS